MNPYTPRMSSEIQYNIQDQYFDQSFYGFNDDNYQLVELNDDHTINCIFSGFMDGLYDRNEVRSIKFDPHEEFTWSISTYGHLNGYFDWNMRPTVSVEVPEMNHKARNPVNSIIDILPGDRADDRVLYILNDSEMYIYSKMGYLKKRIKLPDFQNLTCFSHSPFNSSQLLIGNDSGLMQLDVERQTVVHTLKTSNTIGDNSDTSNVATTALLRYNRGLLASHSDGVIATVDLRAPLGLKDRFRPHLDGLSDFSVNSQGHTVVSCGTTSCHGMSLPDPHLQVYDLRYRKSQCPIKTEMRPTFVRFLPGFNDCILIASASNGFFQIANFGQNILTCPTDQIQLTDQYDSIHSVDISSNASLLAFGNTSGLISTISLGSIDQTPRINNNSRPSILPNFPDYYNDVGPVTYDDNKFIITSSEFVVEPLEKSKLDSGETGKKLSSDWPQHLCTHKYKKFNPVDMSLFKTYPSKFETELIGRKPADWGPVWFPYG